ncbi:MAG: peptidoglycan endopeptidase [Spirochaetaceae bacterium]|jgi:murein DD-endopeptidase|nr:peptidoglycan endopeptidase [Spirochaetaceae bacterium]
MKLNWVEIFGNEKKQFDKMSEAQKFAYSLLLQYNSPYGWGKENPEASDCSGAVCLALLAATGCLVRITADDLYRRVFTVKNPAADAIRVAFFVDRKTKKAIHCSGFVDDGIVLNSQEGGAKLRTFDRLSAWFFNRNAGTEIRGLDKAALKKLSDEGARYDLDKELAKYVYE